MVLLDILLVSTVFFHSPSIKRITGADSSVMGVVQPLCVGCVESASPCLFSGTFY